MYILENNTPFSQSLLWKNQRSYYANSGIEAWRDGDVPHYITNNPAIAVAYAELIFGFLRDRARFYPNESGKIYLLELGTGSGRLAFHLLTRLNLLCQNTGFRVPPFTYIMSDFSESNITFWKNHPKLEPFIKNGWLDFSFFDVTSSDDLKLQVSGSHLNEGSIKTPIIVLANYLWDSVPQDLFYISEQMVYDVETIISNPEDKGETASPAEIMQDLEVDYQTKPIGTGGRYTEKQFNLLLDYYRAHIKKSWVLFPHVAIRCLERLRNMATGGFMLISADKGKHSLKDIDGKGAPQIIKHGGGFSLNVNFHAINTYFVAHGGHPLTTSQDHQSISISTLLMFKQPEKYAETIMAFRNHVEHFGPDDFYRLKQIFGEYCFNMNLMQMESCLRLSGYDTNLFKKFVPFLVDIADQANTSEVTNINLLLHEIWNNYYDIGEDEDLAFDIGSIFYQLECYKDALLFFERSLKAHMPDTALFYNIAGCHYMLHDDENALIFINKTFSLKPEHEGAQRLLKNIKNVVED